MSCATPGPAEPASAPFEAIGANPPQTRESSDNAAPAVSGSPSGKSPLGPLVGWLPVLSTPMAPRTAPCREFLYPSLRQTPVAASAVHRVLHPTPKRPPWRRPYLRIAPEPCIDMYP